MENPNTNKSVIDQATAVADNEAVTKTVNEAANEAVNPAQTTAQKTVQTVAEEANKTADTATEQLADKSTDKSTGKATDAAAAQTERENRWNERKDRDGHHGGSCGNRNDCGAGCHPRRCRAGKWLAMIGLMLATGILGGIIGGKIAGHGGYHGHGQFDRGGMMQRDGMRGGMHGGQMGQGMGMGQGQAGAPMVQPNAVAPADQTPPTNPPAPTR